MKKKINVTFQVQYETEIEVDTDLPEGMYDLEFGCLVNSYVNREIAGVTSLLEAQIEDVIQSKEVSNIPIPLSDHSNYRKNSFEVVNIIV